MSIADELSATQSHNPFSGFQLDETDKLRSENLHLKMVNSTLRRREIMAQMASLVELDRQVQGEMKTFVTTLKEKYGVTDAQIQQAIDGIASEQS